MDINNSNEEPITLGEVGKEPVKVTIQKEEIVDVREEPLVAENKKLYIGLSFASGFQFLIFKLFTMGWLTIMGFFLIPFYLLFFNIATIKLAGLVSKEKSDHILYWVLTGTFLLSGLTFCDFGDDGPSAKLLRFVPDEVLLPLSLSLVGITFILSIVFMIIASKRNKKRLNN